MTFSESIEIILAVPEKYWDRKQNDEPTEEYVNSTKRIISDIGIKTEEISHLSCGIGRGAEGTGLILILLGLFFLGKKIEDNIESWIKIGKRFRKVFEKLLTKGKVYISHPVAALLAISYILNKVEEISILRLINTDIIPVDPSGFAEDSGKVFRNNPERFYIFTFEVNNKEIHIICLKSTGKIEFHKFFSINNWIDFYKYK